MNLCVIGIDHSQAPIEWREKFFLSRSQTSAFSMNLIERGAACGVVILSTCARTEIYAEGADRKLLGNLFAGLFPGHENFLKALDGEAAVAHLFTVAAGADSPVFGDSDVLRQIREALFFSRRDGVLTAGLNRIFERSLCVARRIRQAMNLAHRDVTVARQAVDLAVDRHGLLNGKTVYVVGCGVVGMALVAELCQRKARCIIVSNKAHERALAVAEEHGCTTVRFDEFYKGLRNAEMIFSATACPKVVIKKEEFSRNLPEGRPMVIFDLAVPRDIDPDLATYPGVMLYVIDEIVSSPIPSIMQKVRSLAARKAHEFCRRQAYAL